MNDSRVCELFQGNLSNRIRNKERTFLDLNIVIKGEQFSTKLYDKRDGFNFSIKWLPYKYSNIPS